MTLSVLPDTFAVCRLDPDSRLEEWMQTGEFFSITKTANELSIVCPEENVPNKIKAEKGWKAIKVDGQLDFSLTGIISELSGILAKEKISLFTISTFDTDYLFVKKDKLEAAVLAFRKNGHDVRE